MEAADEDEDDDEDDADADAAADAAAAADEDADNNDVADDDVTNADDDAGERAGHTAGLGAKGDVGGCAKGDAPPKSSAMASGGGRRRCVGQAERIPSAKALVLPPQLPRPSASSAGYLPTKRTQRFSRAASSLKRSAKKPPREA